MGFGAPPVSPGATALAVWAYATRLLTNLDNIRAARIDEITAARLAELDPANLPADVNTLLARLTDARALLLDNLAGLDTTISSRAPEAGGNIEAILTDTAAIDARLPALPATEGKQDTLLTRIGDPTGQTLASLVAKLGDPVQALGTILDRDELTLKYNSPEALDDIAAIGPTNTTERTITVTLPIGATIRRVILATFITAMNDTANAQKISVTVQGRIGAGAWSNFFSQSNVIGFPAADGATTGLVALQDASTLVTSAGSYGFRLSVTQSSGNSVHYTTQYLLIVTYVMSLYEDFSYYTEVDPGNDITRTRYRATWTDMIMSEHSYVYADKGVDHFTNFEHQIDAIQTAMQDDYHVMVWALWNTVGYWNQCLLAGSGIGVFARRLTGQAPGKCTLVLSEWPFPTQFTDASIDLNINQKYYLTIKRSGANFTCDIYSDSARTILVDSLALVLHAACQVAFRYIYPLQEYGEAGWPQIGSGYVEKLWLVS